MSTLTQRRPQANAGQDNMDHAMQDAMRKAEEEEANEPINKRALAYIVGIFIFGSVAFFIAHTGRISPAIAIGCMVVLTLVTRLLFLK